MIALRNQSERHSRQSTIRIGQLREAVEKLERGEDLDVDKLLGDAGESPQDTDWEAGASMTNQTVAGGFPAVCVGMLTWDADLSCSIESLGERRTFEKVSQRRRETEPVSETRTCRSGREIGEEET